MKNPFKKGDNVYIERSFGPCSGGPGVVSEEKTVNGRSIVVVGNDEFFADSGESCVFSPYYLVPHEPVSQKDSSFSIAQPIGRFLDEFLDVMKRNFKPEE